MKNTKVKILSLITLIFILIGVLPFGSACANKYEISREYFKVESYEKEADYSSFGFIEDKFYLEITATCLVDITEFTAEVEVLNYGKLLETQTITKRKKIKADEEFTFKIKLSDESVYERTSSIEVTFTGKSNKDPLDTDKTFEVYFVFNNGVGGNNSGQIYNVKMGTTVSPPKNPTKENFIFKGWFTDLYFNYKYDFSNKVFKNITLYAYFVPNEKALVNAVLNDEVRGLVKIYNVGYNKFLGIHVKKEYFGQGSGFCFHIQNGYYYILTNCHVAYKNPSRDYQKFEVEDYNGNTYTGYLYHNPNKPYSAISAEYDLACIYIQSKSTNIIELNFASENPLVNEYVMALGYPHGERSITVGKVSSYNKITLDSCPKEESNVTFDIINHTAESDHGSSGGPILDLYFRVVGVHYAGSETNSSYNYAIPLLKVKEFLNTYVYN